MSKKETKAKKQQKPQNIQGKIRPHKVLIGFLLGAATVLGGVAAVIFFVPRPTVVQGDPVEPDNPFSASFTIRNTNVTPLNETDACISVGEITNGPSETRGKRIPTFGNCFIMPEWENHYLSMDEAFAITPTDLFSPITGRQVNYADIAIVVKYKTWFWPRKQEKTFRFITHRQSNGRLYWYPETLGRASLNPN